MERAMGPGNLQKPKLQTAHVALAHIARESSDEIGTMAETSGRRRRNGRCRIAQTFNPPSTLRNGVRSPSLLQEG